jgi:hypothetical protein
MQLVLCRSGYLKYNTALHCIALQAHRTNKQEFRKKDEAANCISQSPSYYRILDRNPTSHIQSLLFFYGIYVPKYELRIIYLDFFLLVIVNIIYTTS